MDEFNDEPGTSIAIKRPIGIIIGCFLSALMFAAMAIWLRDWVSAFFAALIFRIAYVWATTYGFAIEKEGIRLPVMRRSLLTPFWPFADDGLYRWDEVSHGHWSQYQPGELNVQIKKTMSPDNALEAPPMRVFYRVPEQYRADVEKALKAHGKWTE